MMAHILVATWHVINNEKQNSDINRGESLRLLFIKI